MVGHALVLHARLQNPGNADDHSHRPLHPSATRRGNTRKRKIPAYGCVECGTVRTPRQTNARARHVSRAWGRNAKDEQRPHGGMIAATVLGKIRLRHAKLQRRAAADILDVRGPGFCRAAFSRAISLKELHFLVIWKCQHRSCKFVSRSHSVERR